MSSGSLLVLSGPSGVGKTTIARLLAKKPEIARVMTTTTRPRRDDEVDGVDYRFLTKEEFKAAVARGEFLEHAEIGSELYGTPRGAVEKELEAGRVVLIAIDPQGARSVRAAGLPAVFVFLVPPNSAELRRRLEGRGSETPEALKERLERAEREMTEKESYDMVVVNDTVDRALEEILEIVRERGLLKGRNSG